jgi:hypothetical protein
MIEVFKHNLKSTASGDSGLSDEHYPPNVDYNPFNAASPPIAMKSTTFKQTIQQSTKNFMQQESA